MIENWIRKHTGGEIAESNNWLSDAEPDNNCSPSGSVISLRNNPATEEKGRYTPTIRGNLTSENLKSSDKRYRRQRSASTLRPEDFYPKSETQKMTLDDNEDQQMLSDSVSLRAPSPPPKEWRAAALPSPVEALAPVPAPVIDSRVKKKVPWNGKNIFILFPPIRAYRDAVHVKRPMKEKQIQKNLRDWEVKDYDIRPFNLGPTLVHDDECAASQCRAIWPSIRDIMEERLKGSFKVCIPNKREWDMYVQELQEAKLRSLGVSLGNEEPVSPYPLPSISNISRHTSFQYPSVPFSPPILTSSANSSHANQNLFSPVLIPGANITTNQGSHPVSVASPLSMNESHPGKFNSRHSISYSTNDHPFGSPFQYAQQQSPILWSPGQMINPQGLNMKGRSPTAQNLSTILSPVSQFSHEGYFTQPPPDVQLQIQERQNQLQTPHSQKQSQLAVNQVSPRLRKVNEHENGPNHTTTKAQSNTSEAQLSSYHSSLSLQEEINDAEYHLEIQMERDLEHDDYSPHSENSNSLQKDNVPLGDTMAVPEISETLAASKQNRNREDEPILHHPQPHSRSLSIFYDNQQPSADLKSFPLEKRHRSNTEQNNYPHNIDALSEKYITKNVLDGPQKQISFIEKTNWDKNTHQNLGNQRISHKSIASLSKLNVAAKEFTFNPLSTFATKPVNMPLRSHNNLISSFDTRPALSFSKPFTSRINVNPASSHGNQNYSSTMYLPGTSDFSFSSMPASHGSTAKRYSVNQPAIYSPLNNIGNTQHNSIFGNIDFGGINITKTSRKSKAIPIIRPDNIVDSEKKKNGKPQEEAECNNLDESRVKRVCENVDSADSVPEFAEPSLPLKEMNNASDQKEIMPNKIISIDKEPSINSDEKLIVSNQISESNSRKREIDIESNKNTPSLCFTGSKKTIISTNDGQKFAGSQTDGLSISHDEIDSSSEIRKTENHENSSSVIDVVVPVECKTKTCQEYCPKLLSALKSSTLKNLQDIPCLLPQIHTPAIERPLLSKSGDLAESIFAPCPTSIVKDSSLNKDDHLSNSKKFQLQSFSKTTPISTPEFSEAQTSKCSQEDTIDISVECNTAHQENDAVMYHTSQTKSSFNPLQNHRQELEYHQNSSVRCIKVPDLDSSSPIRFVPNQDIRSAAPSPSPRRFQVMPGETKIFTRTREGGSIKQPLYKHIHAVDSMSMSDWDDVISEAEKSKIQPRAQFFDNHVNKIVGGILSERIGPLEQILEAIHKSIENITAPSSTIRQSRQSSSGDLSDADDEDDERPKIATNLRWEKRFDKIKAIINECIASSPFHNSGIAPSDLLDSKSMVQDLHEIKNYLHQSANPELRVESLKDIIYQAFEQNISAKVPQHDSTNETRIAYLEHQLKQVQTWAEEEVENRRAAEDRLSEIQRQLRISSEEELRLREAMEQRETRVREILNESDAKVRLSEEKHVMSSMRVTVLESAEIDYQNRIKLAETDLRASQHEVQRLRIDLECAHESVCRHSDDAQKFNEINKELRRTIESLKAQAEESIRVREVMRGKLIGLQEDMARAAREIIEENFRRTKREQELIARQEVLDARLQAEGRTRERLEVEITRLEKGERDAMRAVAECKKLENKLTDLKEENHASEKEVLRLQRESEDARVSGLSQVQRTKQLMQEELDSTKHRMNIMQEDFERQIYTLRIDIEQTKMDADTARERSEMLLEGAEASKKSMESSFEARLSEALEDFQEQHNRRLQSKVEEAQRAEQHLLDRLSLSAAKTEHLQDRVAHLEEKLEIANSAAAAAATAAKTARSTSGTPQSQLPAHHLGSSSGGKYLSGKISPRAYRESIMSLQEQIQQRESTIESLNLQISKLDPDASAKISKRDDEIMWLRELLAVRKSDLTDIVQSLERDEWDVVGVKDAAIRLRTNLQMQEQELERAINGGSALPNLAVSFRDVATPRVAQAVGPLVAVWGSWRKSRNGSSNNNENYNSSNISGTYDGTNESKSATACAQDQSKSIQTPQTSSSTTLRFSSEQLANRPRVPTRGLPPTKICDAGVLGANLGSGMRGMKFETLPILKDSGYDKDATEDLGDSGLYDEECSGSGKGEEDEISQELE